MLLRLRSPLIYSRPRVRGTSRRVSSLLMTSGSHSRIHPECLGVRHHDLHRQVVGLKGAQQPQVITQKAGTAQANRAATKACEKRVIEASAVADPVALPVKRKPRHDGQYV